MATFKAYGELDARFHVSLSVDEAMALDALAGYGVDSFLKVFYEHTGKAYLQPYERGLKSLFATIRDTFGDEKSRIDKARQVFDGKLKAVEPERLASLIADSVELARVVKSPGPPLSARVGTSGQGKPAKAPRKDRPMIRLNRTALAALALGLALGGPAGYAVAVVVADQAEPRLPPLPAWRKAAPFWALIRVCHDGRQAHVDEKGGRWVGNTPGDAGMGADGNTFVPAEVPLNDVCRR